MNKLNFIFTVALNILFQAIYAQNYIREFSSIGEMVSVDNILYLAADDGINGTELWRSDGTYEGTFLIKDICIGSQGSSPSNLVVFNNEVYFSAFDEIHGTELWKSDGTEEGTVMVANIKPDSETYNNGSNPANLIIFKNNVFFTASDDGSDGDLWKTDGSESGTVKAFETNYIDIGELTVADNFLYFVQYYGPRRLWKYDDSGNTVEIPIDEYYNIAELNSFNNELYFITHTSYRQDIRLFRLTTNDQLTLLKEFNQPQYGDIDIDNFVEVNQNVFFSIRTDFQNDPETDVLWKTDGTQNGTVAVKTFDWDRHWSNSYMSDFIEFNNQLYFRGGENTGRSLWKSDGSETGTVQVSDVSLSYEKGFMTISENLLYFNAGKSYNDFELWQSDGTSSGTNIFSDINQNGSSNPHNFLNTNELLYFVADDGNGISLWNNLAKPEIAIKNGWKYIKPDDIVEFDLLLGNSIKEKQFLINNFGKKELCISKITVSSKEFYIKNQDNIILPNEIDTLTVYFFPNSEGIKTGRLSILSNDNNESEFIINMKGTAESVSSTDLTKDSIELVNTINYADKGEAIYLSNSNIDEGLPDYSFVSLIEMQNENSSDWNFSFINGIGDEDNGSFYIEDNKIYTNKVFNYEFKNTCVIRVKATKKTEETSHEQHFIIQINNINENIAYNECGKTLYNISYSLNDVEFINNETVFAVGSDGVIIKSIDAGKNWMQINSGTRASLYKLQFVTENVGYIVGGYGDIVLKTENAGTSWFPIEINNPDYPYVSNLFFITPDKGFVIGGEGKIFKTVDGGKSWDYKTKGWDNLSSVYFVDESTGFVCGRSNTLYKTTDFGENWIQIDMEEFGWNLWFKDIYFTNKQTGYIVCDDGEVLKTTDAGESWAQISDISTDYATKIYFVNENTGFITAGWSVGTIYKTVDAGQTWQEVNSDSQIILSAISGISFSPSGGKGCVVGSGTSYGSTSEPGRMILCSDNSGSSWDKICHIAGDELFSEIAFFDENIGYIFGGDYYSGGVGYKTFDKGITWQEINTPPYSGYSQGVNKCHFINKDTIYVISDSVYFTTDGGNNWRKKETFDKSSLYYFISNEIIYRYSGGDFYKSINAGQSWNLINNVEGWLNIIYFRTENLGFLLGYNVLYRSEDGGANWTEYAHNLSEVPKSITFLNDSVILAGFTDGVLLKSTDTGKTWAKIPTIIKIDIIDFVFYDQTNGLALTNNGGGGQSRLYSTSDAGESWEMVGYISDDTNEMFMNNSNDIYIVGERGAFMKYSQNLKPSQAGYLVGEQIVCKDDIIDYRTIESPYFDYEWSVSNNQKFNAQNNTLTTSWDNEGEYLISLTPVNSCGEGTPQTLTVNVNPPPNPAIIGRDTVYQNEKNVVYSSSKNENDKLLWCLFGNESTNILNVNEISVNWGSSFGKIDLIQTNASGCRQKVSKTITIETINNIETHVENINAKVYPNPTSDFINIEIPNLNTEKCIFTLINSSGKLINKYTMSDSKTSIYVGNLVDGYYLLNIENGKAVKTFRIIIK